MMETAVTGHTQNVLESTWSCDITRGGTGARKSCVGVV